MNLVDDNDERKEEEGRKDDHSFLHYTHLLFSAWFFGIGSFSPKKTKIKIMIVKLKGRYQPKEEQGETE